MADRDPLEAELDRLFALPAAGMVAARNALADALRKAGDRAGSTRIKALKRPTPTAWALNQVHFQHAALLERARSASARLRELHTAANVDQQQLSAALDAQRKAMNAVIDAALALSRAAGMAADAALQRKLHTTLQAWLAGAGDEAPGRMTHDIEASGFEAIAALGPLAQVVVAPRPPAEPAAPPAAPAPQPMPPRAPDPKALARATALVAERDQLANAAAAETRRRREVEAQARRELERAQQQVKDAEQALLELRQRLSTCEAALAGARNAVEAGDQAERRAAASAAEARAALAALQQS